MASGRKPQQPKPTPTLTMSRTEAARRLQERIALGRELRERSISSVNELKLANSEMYSWSEYNNDLLKRMFSNSSYADEYSQWVGFAVLGRTTLSEDIQEYRNDIERDSRRLDSILQRLELIQEPENAKIYEKTPSEEESMITIEKDYVFILMAMSEDHADLEDVHQGIKRVCKDLSLRGERVDDIEHSGRITDKIIECIGKAGVVVADLTYERPNVYYELGYAHGIGRPVVLVAKQGTPLHFDVKDFNVIFYRNVVNLEEQLRKRLSALKP